MLCIERCGSALWATKWLIPCIGEECLLPAHSFFPNYAAHSANMVNPVFRTLLICRTAGSLFAIHCQVRSQLSAFSLSKGTDLGLPLRTTLQKKNLNGLVSAEAM